MYDPLFFPPLRHHSDELNKVATRMLTSRRPFPSFSLALSSLPKQDPPRNPPYAVLSGYYTSLLVPRDLMRTIHPKSDDTFHLPDVFVADDEPFESETEFDELEERSSIHIETGKPARKRRFAFFEDMTSRVLGTFRGNPTFG